MKNKSILTALFTSILALSLFAAPASHERKGITLDGANQLVSPLTLDLSTGVLLDASPFVFEGATADAYETTVAVTDPTADRTVTVPDDSGTLSLVQATGSTAIDYASIATDDSATDTITATGAAAGDIVIVQPSHIGLVTLHAAVTSANTVTVTALNNTAGSIDPAETTIKVLVLAP